MVEIGFEESVIKKRPSGYHIKNNSDPVPQHMKQTRMKIFRKKNEL